MLLCVVERRAKGRNFDFYSRLLLFPSNPFQIIRLLFIKSLFLTWNLFFEWLFVCLILVMANEAE